MNFISSFPPWAILLGVWAMMAMLGVANYWTPINGNGNKAHTFRRDVGTALIFGNVALVYALLTPGFEGKLSKWFLIICGVSYGASFIASALTKVFDVYSFKALSAFVSRRLNGKQNGKAPPAKPE